MFDAVFISDLHLHPDEPLILKRFNAFIDWALVNARCVYVLGDLFHVWVGDDATSAWELSIAAQFRRLVEHGIAVSFMPGNRDFLLGPLFAKQAGFQLLLDPTLLVLDDKPVLLAHGDAYCGLDKSHQRFRRIVRAPWFIKFFLCLPLSWRSRLVLKVRQKSQRGRMKPTLIWDVVPEMVIQAMQHAQVETLIHGHTHKPGLTVHEANLQQLRRFVLSDWDDKPTVLGYNKSTGFKFIQPVS